MHDAINVKRLMATDTAFKQILAVDYLQDIEAVAKALEFAKNAVNIAKTAAELKIPAM